MFSLRLAESDAQVRQVREPSTTDDKRGGHLVLLAAFLVEAQPEPFPLGVVVRARHGNYGADPAEGIHHRGDDRPVAKPDDAWNMNLLTVFRLADDLRCRNWISRGGELWDKPTHFEVRDGKF